MSDTMQLNIMIGAALAGSHKRVMGTARKSVTDYVRGVGSAIKQNKVFQTVMVRSDAQMLQLKNRQQSLNKQLGESRTRWIALGAAIYGATRLIGSAGAIEEQGNYLRTVINTTGNRDMAVGRSMSHARSFGRRSLADEREVLDIEYALNSAGLSEDVSRAGTELVHKLAKVTKGAPGQVGEIFATTLNNLGKDMDGSLDEKMTRIGDVLTKTQFKFQIRDFGQLGESLKYASATMAGSKVQFEQGAAVIGQLNTAGLQGSMAGTAFTAMMKNMGKAGEELGFDLSRSADGSLDLIATLASLEKSLDGLDIDERSDLLQELFADEGKRAVIPLLGQLDELKAAYGEVAEASGSGLVNEEYERFLKSTNGQSKMFGQNLQMIGNVLAGTMLPAVNAVLKPLTLLFGGVAWAIEKFPPLGWIIGGITTAIIGVAAGQMVWVAAQWALNAAMLASPVTWVIAGIVALGAAITWIWKNWDTVWMGIKKVGSVVWDFIKKMFGWTPLGLLIKSWGPALKFIGQAWDKIKVVGAFFKRGSKNTIAATATTVAATTAPLPALPDLPLSASQVAAANSRSIQTDARTTVNLHQQPGQNSQDMAAELDRILEERNRQLMAEQREALHDG